MAMRGEMMRSYSILAMQFPTKEAVGKRRLYELIGHPEKAPDARWDNTCAVRLSLALVRSGMNVAPGYLTIQTGPYKGKRIESRQKELSDFLRRTWGMPEVYTGDTARQGIGQRSGVISFFSLYGGSDRQGHIDLVGPNRYAEAACADDCYWSSAKVWFWPLK
jgi:hypothetical protein